jgi:hypothetical protein
LCAHEVRCERSVRRDLPELRYGLTDRFSVPRCVACDTHVTYPLPVQTYLNELYEKHDLSPEYASPDRTAIVAQVEALRIGQTSAFFADCRAILDVGAYTGENMLWPTAFTTITRGGCAGWWRGWGLRPSINALSNNCEEGVSYAMKRVLW